MNHNGIGMISKDYSTQDYGDLKLCVDSAEDIWEKAIEMVDKRFDERFFENIHFLSCDGRNKYSAKNTERNGFTIMALNCLLVDTFYQFEYGVKRSDEANPDTGVSGNRANYIAFLKSKFNNLFGVETGGRRSLAEIFYEDIRCGILHSAQTYGSSMLSCVGSRAVGYINKGDATNEGIIVEIKPLSNELENYFKNDYIQRLRKGDLITRERFIAKMRYVCNL